jgi:4-diphosphocytidyl-2-C-methyl-D-erythritol kinase
MVSKSYAKVNLAINVIKKLDNGYHEVDMVMSRINFFDKIYISKQKNPAISLSCTNQYVPVNEKNLVYKVAQKVKDEFDIKCGLKIHIIKNVPLQAGLGGGSSNAATTLEMLNKMFNLKMSTEQKVAFTREFGSDIAYFYYPGICRINGQGDQVTPIKSSLDNIYVSLIKPYKGNPTKEVYDNIDLKTCPHPDIDQVVQAITMNDYPGLIEAMDNSLSDAAMDLCEEVKAAVTYLKNQELDKVLVSGTGSSVFGLSKDKSLVKNIKAQYDNKKAFVFATKLITN